MLSYRHVPLRVVKMQFIKRVVLRVLWLVVGLQLRSRIVHHQDLFQPVRVQLPSSAVTTLYLFHLKKLQALSYHPYWTLLPNNYRVTINSTSKNSQTITPFQHP